MSLSGLPRSVYRACFMSAASSFRRRACLLGLLALFCCVYMIGSRRVPPLYPRDDEVFTRLCNGTSSTHEIRTRMTNPDLPVIYFVTPTFSRVAQVAELTRLAQTLLHVPNLVWVVAEDSHECSPVVSNVLARHKGRIPSAHIISPMPKMYEKEYYRPRGVSSRNAAMKWVLKNPAHPKGVLYFGDDDNTYDLRLFDEIRWTKKVSMMPVGLVGKQGISGPIVRDGKVVGFSDPWFESRRFPVDMAGFAVNTELAKKAVGRMPYKAGHEEDLYLRNLDLTYEDIEPKANQCTEVLVWHTQTVKTGTPEIRVDAGSGDEVAGTSLRALLRDMASKGLVKESKKGLDIPICMKPTGCRTR